MGEVDKAGEAMQKTDEAVADETHKEFERSRSTMKNQATSPADQLEKQARKLNEAHDFLEKAQEKAVVKERVYEKESLHNEMEAEHLKRRVEKATTRSERKVEKFFGNVEKIVNVFENRVRGDGKKYKHEVEEELSQPEVRAGLNKADKVLEAEKKAEEEAKKE